MNFSEANRMPEGTKFEAGKQVISKNNGSWTNAKGEAAIGLSTLEFKEAKAAKKVNKKVVIKAPVKKAKKK